jgi:hypothetical protein
MSNISEAIGSIGHLLALDTAARTVAFIDTELHFTDGTVQEHSAAVVRKQSEFMSPVLTTSPSIGDVIRVGLFDEFDDLKEYRIVDAVYPSDKREFKRRVKERQRQIMGARLYQNVMATLIDNEGGRVGSHIDLKG